MSINYSPLVATNICFNNYISRGHGNKISITYQQIIADVRDYNENNRSRWVQTGFNLIV